MNLNLYPVLGTSESRRPRHHSAQAAQPRDVPQAPLKAGERPAHPLPRRHCRHGGALWA